jgi:hypothetical protein
VQAHILVDADGGPWGPADQSGNQSPSTCSAA